MFSCLNIWLLLLLLAIDPGSSGERARSFTHFHFTFTLARCSEIEEHTAFKQLPALHALVSESIAVAEKWYTKLLAKQSQPAGQTGVERATKAMSFFLWQLRS